MAIEITDIEEAKSAPRTPEKKEEEKAEEPAETPPAARRGRPPGAKDKAQTPRARRFASRGSPAETGDAAIERPHARVAARPNCGRRKRLFLRRGDSAAVAPHETASGVGCVSQAAGRRAPG